MSFRGNVAFHHVSSFAFQPSFSFSPWRSYRRPCTAALLLKNVCAGRRQNLKCEASAAAPVELYEECYVYKAVNQSTSPTKNNKMKVGKKHIEFTFRNCCYSFASVLASSSKSYFLSLCVAFKTFL
jgi:hypothetical protein